MTQRVEFRTYSGQTITGWLQDGPYRERNGYYSVEVVTDSGERGRWSFPSKDAWLKASGQYEEQLTFDIK